MTQPPTNDPPAAFDRAGYAAAGFALFVLAAQNSLARWAVENGMTAEDLVAIRFCLPGLFWLPVFVAQVRRGGRATLLRGIAYSATAGIPYGLLLNNGYRFAGASHGSVIVPSATLTAGVIFSALFLKQPVSWWTRASVLTALAGMTLVSGFWLEGKTGTLPGDVLFALSGCVWAFHLTAVGYWKAKAREVVPAVMAVSVLYLPWYLSRASLPADLWSGGGPRWQVVAGSVAFLAVLHSSMALPAYAWATGRLTPLRMSLLTPSIPLIGVAVAVLTLGETLRPYEIAGGALVLAALYLASRARVKRDSDTKP